MALAGVKSSGSELIGGTFRSGSVPTGPPNVRILAGIPAVDIGLRVHRASNEVIVFEWDRPVDGFTIQDDVELRWYDLDGRTGRIERFPIDADGLRLYSTTLYLPDPGEGHVDITVKRWAASDSFDDTKIGPQEPVTVSLYYNTHLPIETFPEVEIDDPPQDPFRGKNLTLIIRWNEIVSGFTLRDDVTVEVNGVEMNAIITNLRVTTDPKVWNADVALPDNTQGILRIRIAADSVQGTQNLGPRSEYVKTINFVNLADLDTTITGSTTICEKIYTYAQKKGACVGILDLIVNDGFVYLITQIVNSSGVTEEQPVDVLLWHLRGKAELIRINLTTCEDVVLEEYPDVLTAPRSFYLFEGKVRFFRGSHYVYEFPAEVYGDFEVILEDGSSETRKHLEIPGYLTLGEEIPDWRGEIGGLYEIDGTDINLIGGIGQSIESNPDALPDDPYNPYYGIHGGMASPIIVSDKEVYAIAGYGKLSEIGKNDVSNSEADRIENWNFGRITDTLDQRLAFLETNDRSGWEVMQDLARVTRSRIGFRGDVFFWEPQKPLTAFLDTTITETADELTFNNPTRQEIPTEGFVKIGGEIIKFGNRVDDDIAQALRGYYGGVPEEHLAENQIVFFQHFITEYNSLMPSTDEDTLYNVVTVNYGDGKSVSKVNPVSLNQYPRRELEITLPLSNHQTAWAEFIAQDYVNDFSGAKSLINCEIELDEKIEVGHVCVVRQRGRAHLNDVAGIVVQVGHQIIQRTTSLILLTISPSLPQTTVGPSDPVPPPVSLDSPVLVYDSRTVNSITVSWVAIAGATKYLAQIRKTGETSWPAEVEVTSPHTFTGLEDGTTYDIRIKASDGTNESAFSETGNVMTELGVPDPPTFGNILRSGNRVFVFLSTQQDVDGYELNWLLNPSTTQPRERFWVNSPIIQRFGIFTLTRRSSSVESFWLRGRVTNGDHTSDWVYRRIRV